MSGERYELTNSPAARSQLAEVLPESIAFAGHEFIVGALLDNPHRVGKRRRVPLPDRRSARRGTYRAGRTDSKVVLAAPRHPAPSDLPKTGHHK